MDQSNSTNGDDNHFNNGDDENETEVGRRKRNRGKAKLTEDDDDMCPKERPQSKAGGGGETKKDENLDRMSERELRNLLTKATTEGYTFKPYETRQILAAQAENNAEKYMALMKEKCEEHGKETGVSFEGTYDLLDTMKRRWRPRNIPAFNDERELFKCIQKNGIGECYELYRCFLASLSTEKEHNMRTRARKK